MTCCTHTIIWRWLICNVKELFQFPINPSKATQPDSDPWQLNGKLSSPELPAVDEVGILFIQIFFIDSHHQDRVQNPPDRNPASSWEVPNLNGRNSTDAAEFPDPEMLGRQEGQLHNPALYRFVLLSYRILSSALSILFEIALSLSLLLSNNHSLLFLSLLSSSSSWLIISENWNLHMESHLYHEKAILNKIFIRNMWSVGFYLFQRGK